MFALSSMLIAGGLAYTGSLAYKQVRKMGGRLSWPQRLKRAQQIPVARQAEQNPIISGPSKQLVRANQTLALSSLALGVTTAGVIVQPLLMVASVPAALFIFAPTIQSAWQTLRQERRISPAALDATRVTLCIVMGYYFVLALDTWLRTLTQRLLLRTETDLQHGLDHYFVEPSAAVWRFANGAELQTSLVDLVEGDIISIVEGELIPADGVVLYGLAWVDERFVTGKAEVVRKRSGDTVSASTLLRSGQIYVQITAIAAPTMTAALRERLRKMTAAGSYMAQAGQRSGRSMATPMLATFALLLPFWDANRAAGFLTTSFGSQMDRLGPYGLQNFAAFALQHNVLIFDGRALEALNLVNTIVFEAAVLTDPTLRAQAYEMINALRQRRWPVQQISPHGFAIYLLATENESATQALAAELGVDDYFVEPLATVRADLLARLQLGGRFVCYVGAGAEAELVTEKATIYVAIPSVGPDAARRLETTTAHVVLVEKDLKRLVQLFEMAAQFGVSEGVNLAWPLLMDLVDISTTVFFHFGLVYSVLFTYSGLLGGALATRLPLLQALRSRQAKPLQPLGPDHQLETTPRPHE